MLYTIRLDCENTIPSNSVSKKSEIVFNQDRIIIKNKKNHSYYSFLWKSIPFLNNTYKNYFKKDFGTLCSCSDTHFLKSNNNNNYYYFFYNLFNFFFILLLCIQSVTITSAFWKSIFYFNLLFYYKKLNYQFNICYTKLHYYY